jgi:cytoskeleton protein RodZ
VFLVVFALLLGALALSLLPTMQPDEWVAAVLGSRQVASQAQPATVTETAVEPAAAIEPAANVPQPVEAQGATPALLPGAASVNSVSTATPTEAAPASATVVSDGGAADPATSIVVFRAKRPSWVEVTDAKGVVAVRRLLAAGEAAGASGVPPLQVIIGRADATEVQVRGKPFDLRKVSRDNVARFEVK